MDIRWLIVVALAVGVAQRLLFQHFGLRRLRYDRHFSERAVYCNEQVDMVERIENDKWLPLPWLSVESMFPTGLAFEGTADTDVVAGDTFQYHQSLFALSAFTRVIRRHRITCLARGVYGIQEATLTCGDLFGGKPRFAKIATDARLTVYPALVALPEIALPMHSWQGPITVRRLIVPDPFTFAGTRDYQDGDPQNQIHWSATARTGRLQVHQRDYTADYRLMVLLNFEVTSDMWDIVSDPAVIERGLSYAATLVQEAINQGIAVGFACNGQLPDHLMEDAAPTARELRSALARTPGSRHVRFAPASGQEHLHAMLSAMAQLMMRCAGSFHTLLIDEAQHTGNGLDYLAITAHRDERLEAAKVVLEAAGHTVSWLKLESAHAVATARAAAQ